MDVLATHALGQTLADADGVISIPGASLGWHRPLKGCGFWMNVLLLALGENEEWGQASAFTGSALVDLLFPAHSAS